MDRLPRRVIRHSSGNRQAFTLASTVAARVLSTYLSTGNTQRLLFHQIYHVSAERAISKITYRHVTQATLPRNATTPRKEQRACKALALSPKASNYTSEMRGFVDVITDVIGIWTCAIVSLHVSSNNQYEVNAYVECAGTTQKGYLTILCLCLKSTLMLESNEKRPNR